MTKNDFLKKIENVGEATEKNIFYRSPILKIIHKSILNVRYYVLKSELNYDENEKTDYDENSDNYSNEIVLNFIYNFTEYKCQTEEDIKTDKISKVKIIYNF